jgi:hypothetical protein
MAGRVLGVHLAAGQQKIVGLRKRGCARVSEGRVRVCASCYAARCLGVSGRRPGGRVCNLGRLRLAVRSEFASSLLDIFLAYGSPWIILGHPRGITVSKPWSECILAGIDGKTDCLGCIVHGVLRTRNFASPFRLIHGEGLDREDAAEIRVAIRVRCFVDFATSSIPVQQQYKSWLHQIHRR